jgi:putative PD-(D/E)XK family protein DUF4420
MPVSVELVWKELERAKALGSYRRIDDTHPGDFYGALDFAGRRGLLLLTDLRPTSLPVLKALDICATQRDNGRWQTTIWLTDQELAVLFTALCDDVLASSRTYTPNQISNHLSARLARWHRLLESGTRGILPINELRGLIGELAILRDCFRRMNPADAVEAWQGPLDAPQDFAFADMLIEAKTVGPTALRVRISSVDQLEMPYGPKLMLAVILLAPAAVDVASGFAVNEFVGSIRLELQGLDHAIAEFDSRLRASGYAEHPSYAEVRFRIDGLRYFAVDEGFPRLLRSDLMPGIADASYDVELAAIAPFERVLAP